jgi:hypothetical protein
MVGIISVSIGKHYDILSDFFPGQSPPPAKK